MSRKTLRALHPFPGTVVLACLFLLPACDSRESRGCPTCVEGVDPTRLIDPATLGDGSGYPGAAWTVARDPRRLGWSEARLAGVVDYAASLGSHGLMVVDRGVVVLEHGHTSRNLIVQSVRKSFLSALFGIYHHLDLINLQATMEDLGIDDLPPSLTPEEKQATVEHLLMARSGIYHEAAAESPSMKAARPPRGSHPPGTFWYYNNWDFNALGTIFIQLTGKDVFQALHDDLAVPLQMQEFLPANGWYFYQEVSEHPAYHFTMSPRDMARFGLLMLREGRWRDRQIVPESWVRRSLQPYSDAGSGWSYGCMWWVGKTDAWEGHQVFAALGGTGQATYVVPGMEVVITHKVDHGAWAHGWTQVNQLVRMILAAKVM